MSLYTPTVNVAKELAEISKDFTSPRELIRETISNALDASASRILVDAFKDDSHGDDDLVVRIIDDGVGMTRRELEGFFDLGYSSKRDKATAIGNKGHGTKIAYNSSQVTVVTKSIEQGVFLKAVLDDPRRSLNRALKSGGPPPQVEVTQIDGFGAPELEVAASGTIVEVRGYDNNNWNAFAHGPLRDYIEWFTAWGSIRAQWGDPPPPCVLHLQGIGQAQREQLQYGHPFPEEESDFRALRKKDDRRPENFYVRRWVSPALKVNNFPDQELHVVFSVEGDSAKRNHNVMLKRVGRPSGTPFPWEQARYRVTDRYGIYVCRDGIPIERKNERFADRSEWTKWHAFIDCAGLQLTANRASVENTASDLLAAIYDTAEEYIKEYVLGSDEYEEFARRIQLEAGRRKAERERKDVTRRYKAYKSKKRYQVSGGGKATEFLEPRTEQGVVWLLAKLTELWPEHFPNLKVVDLDSHFGYDLLVLRRHILTGNEEPAFTELKLNLRDSKDFNHSFDFLNGLVCWETNLQEDEELRDIQDHLRVFKKAAPDANTPYTRFYLNNPVGGVNIEVTVLKSYLEEVLALRQV